MSSRTKGKWADHKPAYQAYLQENDLKSAYQLLPQQFLTLYKLTGVPHDRQQMKNFLTNYLLRQWGDDKEKVIGKKTQSSWVDGIVDKAYAHGVGGKEFEDVGKEADKNIQSQMDVDDSQQNEDGHHSNGEEVSSTAARGTTRDAAHVSLLFAQLRQREQDLERREMALDERAVELSDREAVLDEQEVVLSNKESALKTSENNLRTEKDSIREDKEKWEQSLRTTSSFLDESWEKLYKNENRVAEKMKKVDSELREANALLEVTNDALMDQAELTNQKQEEIEKKDEDIKLKEKVIQEMEKDFAHTLAPTFIPPGLELWASRLRNSSTVTLEDKAEFQMTCKEICGKPILVQEMEEAKACWEKGQLVPALRKLRALVGGVWDEPKLLEKLVGMKN
ncbi:uncharacterized protein MYCFIDRAFT_84266 [Pseudocercospora fijiensis CIRAD86]|uniref:Uncharacterized protein n=1 Tax=Pseudocercospora fijiensis (strain CIRAD86) TaxID=383855 RepID=M2ZYE0_PSEFD|nr:uncharacterized protein MYCFIDRAFT_84266 [Pseudocercospora fijiensis CIRAD86]EME77131.1 hypothetical protein MYCFIDRAFT_84266 [Pseudocercospora fijiensis CIRAD86]